MSRQIDGHRNLGSDQQSWVAACSTGSLSAIYRVPKRPMEDRLIKEGRSRYFSRKWTAQSVI